MIDRNGESRLWRAGRVAATTVLLGAWAVLFAGCAKNKEKVRVFQRGWVGGEYQQAHVPKLFSPSDTLNAFPEPLRHTQKAGQIGRAHV
jgi:hypothetical protein